MNGVHDMGGMHGFGPIQREEEESVFHASWEGRVFGIVQALGPHGIHDPHGLRFAIESMELAKYLASSYYERWLLVTERALLGNLNPGGAGYKDEIVWKAAGSHSSSAGRPCAAGAHFANTIYAPVSTSRGGRRPSFPRWGSGYRP